MRVGRSYTYFRGSSSDPNNNACVRALVTIIVAIVLVAIPAFVIDAEHTRREMTYAFQEAREDVHETYGDANIDRDLTGKLIHLTSKDIRSSGNLRDDDFHIAADSSLRLKRHVEYCQWMEHSSSRTTKERDGREKTTVTYYYTLGWHNRHIISLGFDQPAAHHNPLRDPFPERTLNANHGTAGMYKFGENLITKLSNFKPLLVGQEDQYEIQNSPAAQVHGFKYIGNGWFYSKHDPSQFESVARLAGMAFEGSLLDFQIGDLFKTCQAGDIRTRFEVVQPAALSILAEQLSDEGHLGEHITSRDYRVLIAHEEYDKPADKMFDDELRSQSWTVFFSRLLTVPWAFLLLYVLEILPSAQRGFAVQLVAALALAGSLIGVVFAFIWGPTVRGALWILPALLFAYLHVRDAKQQQENVKNE